MLSMASLEMLMPSVDALTSATMEVYPNEGDVTTEILVHVRGSPYKIDTSVTIGSGVYLYLYWDTKCISEHLEPKIMGRFWELTWDVHLRPPNEFPFSELGNHTLRAVLESGEGEIAETSSTFKIVKYLPPPEWWTNLPQEILDQLKGNQGIPGLQGKEGIQGPMGPQGEQGIQGEQGPQGVQGKEGTYPISFLLIPTIISAIALIAVFIKKESKKT